MNKAHALVRPKCMRFVFVGLLYLGLSLFFGEVHPFTTVPMYSNFPNWAYSFYISNPSGRLVPVTHYYNCASDELSHQYSAICSQLHIPYGNRIETARQLQTIGQAMFAFLQKRQIKLLPEKERLQLHRVCYYIQNDTIASQDTVLYEESFAN